MILISIINMFMIKFEKWYIIFSCSIKLGLSDTRI